MTLARNQCVALTVALIIGLLAAAGVAVAQEDRKSDGSETGKPLAPQGSLNEPPENSAAIVETPDGDEYAAGELIVTYDDKKAKEKADKKGGKKQTKYGEFLGDNVEVLTFEDAKGKGIEALKEKKAQVERSAGVKSVELNPVAELLYAPNDPYFNDGSQWYLKAMDAPSGWDYPHALGNPQPGTSRPVRIAIIDSGYDATHQDMCATYNPDTWFCTTGIKVVAQRDFTDGDNYASDDSSGHGTFMASIASGRTGNQLGLAGASPFAQLIVAKTINEGYGTCGQAAAGVNYAVTKGAKVISISLGYQHGCDTLKTAVDDAYNAGVTVVAAAGNWNYSVAEQCGPSITIPAYYQSVIAVGGSEGTSAWEGSCNGPEVDVAAQSPGVIGAIPTYNTPAGYAPYAKRNGTSNSAPLVAGLVANVISTSDVAPTQAEIRSALYKNADDIAAPGKDEATGYGRVNFYRTLKAAQAY
jgi:hypothetical protein